MKTQDELFAMFEHFVDSHHGIYSGQIFAQSLDFSQVEGISQDDWDILLAGPDHEHYVEVWADELQNVIVKDSNGKRFLVWENEGIFLYPEEIQDQVNWDELSY